MLKEKRLDDSISQAQLASSLTQSKSDEAFQRLQANLLRKTPKGTGQ